MPTMVKIKPGAVTVGEPLLFSVYDEAGSLLLRQGYVVETREQLDKLYERGMYQDAGQADSGSSAPATTARLNPFEEFPVLISQLKLVLSHIAEKHEDSPKRLGRLTAEIHKLSVADPDACIALVHFHADEPTAHEQTLFHALLADRIGRIAQLQRAPAASPAMLWGRA